MARILFAFGLLLCASLAECYHILVMFPFPGRSHSILGYGHVNRLLDAGHEVTFVTAFPKKNDNPKLHIIDNSCTLSIIKEDSLNLEKILDQSTSVTNFTLFYKMMIDVDELTYNNVHVQKMLQDDTIKFDTVIVEWIVSDYIATFATYYEAPLIYFGSTEPHPLLLRLIDEAPSSAFAPSIFSSAKTPFTFMERVIELGTSIFLEIFCDYFVERQEAVLYQETIAKLIAKKGRVPPAYKDIKYNASLMLGNSHVSLGSALRLPQSYKPIGGYHIDDKVAPLPEDLKKLMDSSKHGAIYFSMGSNLKSKNLPNNMKAELLKLFGSLKQTVIWKFEEVMADLPKNVHILQWAPQPSILAHPNTVLFITHGGLLSTTEAVHFGVPTIGIPVFGDQFTNVQRSFKKGFALKVDLSYNLAADLKVAINEILSDPKYTNKAKELSLIYHDRPVSPGRELVHWVEHVVKTRGAPHLRSPALHTPWYQKMYLDLLNLILIVVFILKKILRSLCCRKKVDIQKKRN